MFTKIPILITLIILPLNNLNYPSNQSASEATPGKDILILIEVKSCVDVSNSSEVDCEQLVLDCQATADENLSSGLWSYAIWDMFHNNICINEGINCVFQVHG